MADNEKQKMRLKRCLEDRRVKEFLRQYYASEAGRGVKYPASIIGRWKKGTTLPPVDVLAGMAKALDTNMSYILGLTDVKQPLDYDRPMQEMTLDRVLEIANMSEKEFVKALNKNYKKLYLYRERLPYERVRSMIKLSEVVGLSLDYILGYTQYENWDLCAKQENPFRRINAGDAAYVIADKDIHGISDIEDAIRRKDGAYCLVSSDGKYVYFPNGNKARTDDDIFKGVLVVTVKPEVK